MVKSLHKHAKMINLLSTVDGFKIILGNCMVNIACLLVLGLVLRGAPDYPEDLDRSEMADTIFLLLLLMHLTLSIVTITSLYISDTFDSVMSLCLFGVVFMVIKLCNEWLYMPDRNLTIINVEQREFETWLWIEVLLIWASIGGSIIYILWCRLFGCPQPGCMA